jgi:FkbM family methyltransferase
LGRLRRNRECNSLDFRIFPVGLSDSEGRAELIVAEDSHAGLNTLGTIPYKGVVIARRESVQLVRLDDVVADYPLSRIDLVKIDVEGAELRVLRGAMETLRHYRPFMLFEVLAPPWKPRAHHRKS